MRLLLIFLCLFSGTSNADGFKISDFSRSDSDIKLVLFMDQESDQSLSNIFNSIRLDRLKLYIKVTGEPPVDFVTEFASFDMNHYFSLYQKSKVAYSKEFESIRETLKETMEATTLISTVINEAARNDYQHINTSHEKFSLQLPLFISLNFEKKPNKNHNEMDGSVEPPL